MIDSVNKEDCSGCHACYSLCPQHCIEMKADNEGFLYPIIDYSKCTKCGICEKACQSQNPLEIKNTTPIILGAINKETAIRKESSSGGIFSLLAEEIINRGGAVFGPAFDSENRLKHICIDSLDDLDRLRGSKYVQSEIGDGFAEVKGYLDDNRFVLFTGTPCQVNGLLHYLPKKYDKLYIQDIVCHGVPSPMVWEVYLAELKRKFGEVDGEKKICFRSKLYGWLNYSMEIPFYNSVYSAKKETDSFLKAFLANLSLRPSCYHCHNKGIFRNSDITLADFWAVKHLKPELFDDQGTSLVFVNSEKGQELFNGIKESVIAKDVDLEQLKPYINSAFSSVPINRKRKNFMNELGNTQFDKLVNKYSKKTILLKIKILIARVFYKMLGRKSKWN